VILLNSRSIKGNTGNWVGITPATAAPEAREISKVNCGRVSRVTHQCLQMSTETMARLALSSLFVCFG